jgi:energy-coupling factor transporter ATP-binding protein EcfA2
MVVAIVAGEEGSGKTTQLLKMAEMYPPARWGIMEMKDEEQIMERKSDTFNPEVLYEMYEDGHVLQGNNDPLKTVKHVERWMAKTYTMRPRPQTVVLDGISDLRAEATDAWILEDNIARESRGRGPREAIGEKNIGAWGAVNDRVKKILTPLINMGLKNHINIFLTAQMKDKYVDGEIVGIEPALKPYMSYPIPCLFVFSYNGNGYKIACTKEPKNPRWHVDGVEKHTGFFDALDGHGLILSPVRERTYMITYELEGEKKRAFVNAETTVDAENKFTRGYPGCAFLEVTT